jgi:hypothetical protein
MANWAVFTGDIVKSSELSSEELARIFDGIAAAAEAIASWQDRPTRLTRFRGDGWQMAVTPELTLRAALTVRAAVRRAGKGFDSRIGIGFGEGTIPGSSLANASGTAFLRSGHALDTMKRTTRMAAPESSAALRAVLPLADQIVDGWTVRQAEIGFLLLPPHRPTQTEVAEALDQTRQSVQQQSDQSGVSALLETCVILESEAEQGGETSGD